MVIQITSTSTQPVSTGLGIITAGQTLTQTLLPQQAQEIAYGLTTLVNAGRLTVQLLPDPGLLPIFDESDGTGTFNTLIGNPTITVKGSTVDSASAVSVVVDSVNTLSTLGAKLLSIRNGGVEQLYFDYSGNISIPHGFISFNVNEGGLAWGGGGVLGQANLLGSTASTYLYSATGDGAAQIGVIIGTGTAYVTPGALIAAFANGGVSKLTIDKDGNLSTGGKFTTASYTDSSGSPGNVSNNSVSGRAAVASGAQTCVVTNSSLTATSVIHVVLENASAGVDAVVISAHGASSFTVTTMKSGAATNTTANATFSFMIFS